MEKAEEEKGNGGSPSLAMYEGRTVQQRCRAGISRNLEEVEENTCSLERERRWEGRERKA